MKQNNRRRSDAILMLADWNVGEEELKNTTDRNTQEHG